MTGEHHVVDPDGHLFSPAYSAKAKLVSVNGGVTTIELVLDWPRLYTEFAAPAARSAVISAATKTIPDFWSVSTADALAHVWLLKDAAGPVEPARFIKVAPGPGRVTCLEVVKLLVADKDSVIIASTLKEDHPAIAPKGASTSPTSKFILRHWACPYRVAYRFELKTSGLGPNSHRLVVQYPGLSPHARVLDADGGIVVGAPSYPFEPLMAPAVRTYDAALIAGV